MSSKNRFSSASIALVLAAGASLVLLALAQTDPRAAAETRYLAVWSTAVLLCAAGLAGPPSLELMGAALAIVLAAWVLPAGPVRGATIGLLLTATLGLALSRRLIDQDSEADWGLWVTAALGTQLLCRSDQLLAHPLEPRSLVGLIVLPLATAWALGQLSRSRTVGAVLLAAGSCVILVPGWSVAVALSLLGVALGASSSSLRESRWVRPLGLALVAGAGYTWHPSLPAVILLSALLVAGSDRWQGAGVVALGTAVALALLPGVRGWNESLLHAGLLLALLPLALLVGTKGLPRLLAALLLAVLAARAVPLPGALAAPLVAVALGLAGSGSALAVQRAWTATLVSGTLLLAAYPWLRAEPLRDMFRLFGLGGTWSSLVGIAIGFLVIGWLGARAQRRSNRTLLPSALALTSLALAALQQLPPAGIDALGGTPVVLTVDRRELIRTLEHGTQVNCVVLDSYLENSTRLASGTPVADMTLETEDGGHQRWLLRAGIDSGEWAARRRDVAALDGFQAPAVWLAWIPADGEVFAQRYRSRWKLRTPAGVTRLTIRRRPEMPPELGIAILRLELRP